MEATINKIIKYRDMGLTTGEIGKLMDLSTRTIQRHLKDQGKQEKKETTPRNRQTRALELHAAGYSYSEIASKMKVSKTTAYLWHRKHSRQKEE